MSKQLKLKIVTPERLVLEEMVDQVSLPTTEGEITILSDHIPLVVGLKSGDVVVVSGGEQIPMAVAGGFLEVKKNEEGKKKAEELKKKMTDKNEVDFEHFEAELERSLTRVKIADKWRKRKYRK